MYEIETQVEVSAAHRLYYHTGVCYRLHGHNYIITVIGETADKLGSTGMVRDFKEVKKQIWDIVSLWDHKTLLNAADPLVNKLPSAHIVVLREEPTAECLAKNVGEQLIRQERLRRTRNTSFFRQITIKVQETEKNIATYTVEV